MSPDRVIYSFVLGWVVLIAVLIALDWLGNPNRGGFRPAGARRFRDRQARKTYRARHQLEGDAVVRAALRDAYGASSLRFSWNRKQEDWVRGLDDGLIVADTGEAVVEAESREIVALDHTLVVGDALPNLRETPAEPNLSETPADPVHDTESADEPPQDQTDDRPQKIAAQAPPSPSGWNVGADPLALTAKGTPPVAGTIRSRVWKNHGVHSSFDEENVARLRAGKAPHRHNPVTGRNERATVDVETGRGCWENEPVDPFGGEA